jgi:AcrR family transcriptional regulator
MAGTPELVARTVRSPQPPGAPFETQGERRRAQIVAIAAELVVSNGAEAVTHAAIAERAGIHRTAVYKYFPTREDLLAAIPAAYLDLHATRITTDDAVAGIVGLAHATPKRMPPETRLLLEKLWDPQDWTPEHLRLRLATVILNRDPELLVRLHAARPELAERWAGELSAPLTQLGLDPVQARTVSDVILAVQYHATAAALDGTFTREQAMELTYKMSRAAMQAFLD